MRVWRFYLITNKNEKRKDLSANTMREKYPLYAITEYKDRAMDFIESRDMNQFIMKTSKGVDPDEWTKFKNKHRGSVLEYHKLKTRGKRDKETGKATIKKVEVLMTYAEYTNSTEVATDDGVSMALNEFFMTSRLVNPFCFQKKYHEILEKLMYNKMYYVYVDDPFTIVKSLDEDYTISFHGNFIYDELAIFIKEHGDTFKRFD